MTRHAGREAPAARGGAGASARTGARMAGGASALGAAVRAKARELGFDLVGITTPEPSEHVALYRRWLAAGRHGEMAYLARPDAVARRGDLSLTLLGVRSVIVVGHEYYQEDPPGVPDDPSRGVIARYARGRDYHRVVKKKLTALGRWLESGVQNARGAADAPPASASPPPVSWRAYVDTGPILERDLARRAGLGWVGKNTLLIHPRKGSYFFLGVLLTDLALEPDVPFQADHCGTCRACLDACPTGALLGRDEGGAPVMDATRCISYLTIEHRGGIPEELRPHMGSRVYGCDICQEVCPWNGRFAEVAAERDYAARPSWEAEWDAEDVSAETCRGGEADSGDVNAEDVYLAALEELAEVRSDPVRGSGQGPLVSAESSNGDDAGVTAASDDDGPTRALIPTTDGSALVDLLRMGEDEWDAYTRGSAVRRAGYVGLRRNVAIALGNWLATGEKPDPDAVGELVAALSDEDAVVAEVAAWALRRARIG
ncbi:MAG: tRNA epoxyqueuosine(34) reductase QueG [Longimicrobiales bacterium]